MSERKRIEIGFDGGQVVSLATNEDQLDALHKALETETNWHHLDIEDGSILLDLSEVVFVKTTTAGPAVGFSG